MKRAILGAALCLGVTAGFADELKLRDGTKITGTIVGFEGDSFKVETSFGFALVKKDKVASISISEPKKKETVAAKTPAPAPSAAPPQVQPVAPAGNTQPPSSAETNSAPVPPPAAKVKNSPPPEPVVREEVDKTNYTNFTYGFKMYKPPRWNVIEGAHKTLPSAVVAMGTTDEQTILVVGREVSKGSLDAQASAAEKRLKEIYENYRPMGEQHTVVAGVPAVQKKFRGMVGENDWSGVIVSLSRGNEFFTILGMTYADSDLIQIQENVIARTIASLEFTKR
ncbi:MAG: hypothetical protein HY046_09115 [Acidobacteria bacterium]|nr:hypothetical protein [Acidobacteriota bacterium]